MHISTSYQQPENILIPQSVPASQNYDESEYRDWLEHAIKLNRALISSVPEVRALAEHILPELIEAIEAAGSLNTSGTKSRSQLKEAVKVLLINLYVAYLLGQPVRYSRDSHHYSRPKRYGYRYFKYDRIMAVVDALLKTGYIEQAKGFFAKEKDFGRQSRMWASDGLIALFQEFLLDQFKIAETAPRTELIELRNKAKDPIAYRDTKRTYTMRKNLRLYNNFINQFEVTVQLTEDVPVGLNNLYKRVLSSVLLGNISITQLTVDQDKVANLTRSSLQVEDNHSTNTTQVTHTPSMTHKISQIDNVIQELQSKKTCWLEAEKTACTATEIRHNEDIYLAILSLIVKKHFFFNRTQKGSKKIIRKEIISRRNKKKHPLHYFGIQQIEFTVNAKNLHRVFNKSKFTLGGRFYGAYHETIPKKFRRNIKIDGQETVECDYKAHHLRMPYHLLGIDYQDDPYMVLAADDNERKIYKKLCLIAINAENETKAIQGFRKQALEEDFGIALTNERIRSLLDWLKIVHHPIAEYIHSKKGLKLQYLDSKITEVILLRMTKQGIPCLPVHDSYVVPALYEEQLLEAMMEEYRQVMEFEPVVEKK